MGAPLHQGVSSIIFLKFPYLCFLAHFSPHFIPLRQKRTKKLKGKAKKRAYDILDYAEENFNWKASIIEDNLKRIDALSERVGTICKYFNFKAGKPVPTSSDEESDEGDGELVKIDEDKQIDFKKGNLHFSSF